MIWIDLTVMIFLVLFFGLGGYLVKKYERKQWNQGISPYDGTKWKKQFDMDSQGGRGYKDNSGNYIWISWNVDN